MKRLLFILCLLITATPANADTIYLKNGRVIYGKVIHQTSIYVRLEPKFMGDPEREFLVDNIDRIEINNIYENPEPVQIPVIPAQEVISYVSNPDLNDVPESVQQAARDMAESLLEQAMRDVKIPSIEDAPENVKRLAEERATDILAQAMSSLNETPQNVKDAAREIANSLLEETVRTTSVNSINEVPNEVKQAAQDKATLLIEQAMVGSVDEAPDQVKLAAQLKARSLIEEAMLEVNVLDAMINEGRSVQQEYELSTMIQDNKKVEAQRKLSRPTFEREIPTDQVEALMKEAVNRRVEQAKNNISSKSVQSNNEEITELADNDQSDLVELQENVAEANIPVEEEIDLPVEDLESRISAIPQPMIKEVTFLDFISELSHKDFLVMGLCVILLLVLLNLRTKSSGPKVKVSADHDIKVISSITFQNLPESIKAKITSSDVTAILELEDIYQKEIEMAAKGEVVIEQDKLIAYIQEHAAKKGNRFAYDDVKKVLEVKEQSATEVGLV